MANEPLITVVGNIGGDPELRFTPAGKAVCGFSVGSTPRVKDGDQWTDGTTTWLRCTVWDAMAEHVAESLERGHRVIAQGRLSTREYEDREGNQRSSLELQVEAIGPELRWATARVNKAASGGAGKAERTRTPVVDDPWATPATDEPPF